MKTADDIRREFDCGPNITVLKPKAEKPAPDEFEQLGAVWADDIELDLDRPGLVDGLLGSTAMTVVYGESGSGKTFFAVDIACHVAAGLPWRGMDVERGIVVYVAAEAPASIKRRIWAWKRRHEVERLEVLVVTAGVNLLNGDTEKVTALISRVREESGRTVALVVVDTLARAMVGNENSPEDMGAFVAACGRIREASGGHVMVVHHSGKDQARGARGHSSLRAATDVEMEVTRAEEVRSVTVKKNRDGEEGATYGFKLEVMELGTNAKGRTVTTCVAATCDPPAAENRERPREPKGNDKTVMDALAAAISDHGRSPPPAADIPRNARGVAVEQWREAALRYLPSTLVPKRKGETFKRAMERLVANRFVRHVDGFCWLPSNGRSGRTGSLATAATTQAAQVGSHGSQHPIGVRPCDRATAGSDSASAGLEDEGRSEELGDNGIELRSGEDLPSPSSEAKKNPGRWKTLHSSDAPCTATVLRGSSGRPWPCKVELRRLAERVTPKGVALRMMIVSPMTPGATEEILIEPSYPTLITADGDLFKRLREIGDDLPAAVRLMRAGPAKVLVDTFGETP